MRPSRSTTLVLCGAAAVSAQGVAAKATRDALFLTSLDFTALPAMLVATSVCTILVLAAYARGARTITPAVLMPAMLAVSGALFVLEWLLRAAAPAPIAILVYLHVSISGSLLASVFWLTVSEQHDPWTAKRRIGPIAGAGTLGGLLGALFAERVAAFVGAPEMLICLAGFQFLTAWLLRRTPLDGPAAGLLPASPRDVPSTGAAWPLIATTPHLQILAALVLLGTTSAALLDYLFKAKAVATFGPGDNLLRFFALYYAGTGLVTFVLQTASSRTMLERFGIGLTASTPSIALLSGSIAGLIVPGFGSVLVARAGESVFRGSWFRAGYELFYAAVPGVEKRATKSLIDVGADRLGEAFGGGLVRVALAAAPATHSSVILFLAIVTSAGAIVAASCLNRWYSRTLERTLMHGALGRDRTLNADDSLRRRLLGIARRTHASARHGRTNATTRPAPGRASDQEAHLFTPDAEIREAMVLRSRDVAGARAILRRERGLDGGLVHHAIPLLADRPLVDHAMFALCKVAEEHVGELGDALLDPRRDLAIRSHLAQVFAVCFSQRAVDVLLTALEDEQFDVRFQAARSLAAIHDKNPRVVIDRQRIAAAVLHEVDAVSSQRSLAHDRLDQLFSLLALVLPREQLRVAYHGLRSDDQRLKGTALEYLEGVLPNGVRQRLWPLLVTLGTGKPAPAAEPVAPPAPDLATGDVASAT